MYVLLLLCFSIALYGYSVNSHFSASVRVRVLYYFIFRDQYMKYWPKREVGELTSAVCA